MGYPRANCSCRIVGVQGIAWGFGGGHVWSVSSKEIVPNQGSVLHCDAMPWYDLWCWCCQRVPTIFFKIKGGGANVVSHDYTKGDEIVGTSILVYTVFSATVAQRNARHSHVPILAPLPIGFAVFLVHLATIPIKDTGINPARSLGAAIVYNGKHAWMTIRFARWSHSLELHLLPCTYPSMLFDLTPLLIVVVLYLFLFF